MELDVLTETSCYRAIERAVERFGCLDIFVNNAGTSIRKAPEDLTAQDWHLVMDTNLTSAFLCSNAAYPHMRRAGGGKIINIGSMMSIFGMPFATAYAASKGGIVQMTRAMATAWVKDNIQVNAILPGWIDTDLTRSARQQVPDLHEKVLARTPAQRWGTPDDFTGIAIFRRRFEFITCSNPSRRRIFDTGLAARECDRLICPFSFTVGKWALG